MLLGRCSGAPTELLGEMPPEAFEDLDRSLGPEPSPGAESWDEVLQVPEQSVLKSGYAAVEGTATQPGAPSKGA